MSSPKSPERVGRDALDAMFDAISLVAERNFFSVVERCDDQEFAARSAGAGPWVVAAVRFSDAVSTGELSCAVPEHLARAMFDAFAGLEPGTSRAGDADLFDLIGELTNMVCGVWLSQMPRLGAFSLVRPAVRRDADLANLLSAGAPLLLLVNDVPVVLHMRVAVLGQAATTGGA